MDNLRELYQQVIIDHSRNPRNFGQLDEQAQCANGFNPLCGDKLRLCINVKDDMISDIRFKGEGCAISTASASMLTEQVIDKTIAEAEQLIKDFQAMLVDEKPATKNLGKLEVLKGVAEFPARIKCATLAWHALDAAIHNQDEASTE